MNFVENMLENVSTKFGWNRLELKCQWKRFRKPVLARTGPDGGPKTVNSSQNGG